MELIYFTKLIIKGIESIKLNFVDFYEKNEYLNDPIFRLNTIQYHHLDLEKLSHRIKHKEENCVFDLIFNDKISSLGFYFCNFNYSKKELIPYFKALLLVNKQVIFNKKDVSNNMKSNIKELILLSTTLSYESSNIINQLFNKIQLKTIKLINCQLKDDCYFILFKNLIGSFYFNELYLENVILNDTIGDILIELLSHPNCQLKVLSLSNSYIIKEFLVKLSIGLSKNVTLMELNLDKVGIENEDNESMCKLLKSISQHKKLEIINLSQFEIELDLISNLLSHLNQIDNLKELNLFGLYLANPSSLYQLSSLFQHSKLNVLKLDFKGCKFKEIAAPFFKLFSDIKNLKQICIPSSRITDIDIEYLINYLIDTSLHLIDLSNNQITIHGIKKLFDCLKKCRNSKLKVKLNGNKISLFDIENNSYLFDKYSKLIIDKSTLDDTTKMIVDGFDEF
ncbi:RNI-like protein [Neoconidiobolus thromboides FSU 785]|nr:RNI-like protein [Neoconidiobolus thromboides FSU 785]